MYALVLQRCSHLSRRLIIKCSERGHAPGPFSCYLLVVLSPPPPPVLNNTISRKSLIQTSVIQTHQLSERV